MGLEGAGSKEGGVHLYPQLCSWRGKWTRVAAIIICDNQWEGEWQLGVLLDLRRQISKLQRKNRQKKCMLLKPASILNYHLDFNYKASQ